MVLDMGEGINCSDSVQEEAGKGEKAKSNRYHSVCPFVSESCTKQLHQRAPSAVGPQNTTKKVGHRSSTACCRNLALTLIPASLEGAAATELPCMQSLFPSGMEHIAAERTEHQHFLDRGLA